MQEKEKPAKESKAKANTDNSIIADKFREFVEYIEDSCFDTDDLEDDDDYFDMKKELFTLLGGESEVEEEEVPYSSDEIEDMFKNMK